MPDPDVSKSTDPRVNPAINPAGRDLTPAEVQANVARVRELEPMDALLFIKKWCVGRFGPDDIALILKDLLKGGMKPGTVVEPENEPPHIAELFGFERIVRQPNLSDDPRGRDLRKETFVKGTGKPAVPPTPPAAVRPTPPIAPSVTARPAAPAPAPAKPIPPKPDLGPKKP